MSKQYLKEIAEDEALVQREFDALLEDYINSNHRKKTEIIKKAFHFAKAAHKGLKRRSGEPYIIHPIAVARIVLNEIGLGSTSICSALLHDVVEDTEYTVEDISNHFGPKIAQIVDGLTKIAGGVFGDKASGQAENFRKLLLTMSEDIRVILIKIADRLHNMRTLGSMPPAKQYKIAGETEYIYAPLAHRLGLFRIKTELENLSFKYDHPETYHEIEQKLEIEKQALNKFYIEFSKPIFEKLQHQGYRFELKERIKSVYSIWNKMSSRNIPFEEVYDILALRIIFEPKEGIDEKVQCWMIYSAITAIYKPHPERIRDWVSTPKANGYEALHVTVMTPGGRWVEIQIRSRRMHDIAERGLAAHWKYKTGEDDESELDKWLKTIKELLENPEPNAIDFMDTFKLNLFASEIFVFTPKGDIKTIANGATALDFGFMLHTEIGYQSIAAKVNHKLVPLNHILSSGDQVEILTSKKQVPQREWLDFVTTGHAKSKLQSYFKKEEKAQALIGVQKFEEVMSENNLRLNKENIDQILSYYNLDNINELYVQIGKESIRVEDIPVIFSKSKSPNILSKILRNPFSSSNGDKKEAPPAPIDEVKAENHFDFKKTYILNELNVGKMYELAPCCHPIPGDDVLGYASEEGIIIVHKRQCKVANVIKSNFGNRILNVEWRAYKSQSFVESIEVKGIDKTGMLIEILKVISEDYNVNIRKIFIESNNGLFTGNFDVHVHNTEDINNLVTNLLKLPEINSVKRIQNFQE
ncbi:MAG: bifunctional (p)ppGpp synthetase/guanosine-3',5'-bis(diphosphate) 3'-pyrophosphohydrolase [Porphyromonadaceae bacterium]|nr:bifunctional (p)ppGpp synthetase/guanosine-3',5'-bis(diphosphate) 3'-pyrophosphohydrolase [Porphyromonadaceae bacterium]